MQSYDKLPAVIIGTRIQVPPEHSSGNSYQFLPITKTFPTSLLPWVVLRTGSGKWEVQTPLLNCQTSQERSPGFLSNFAMILEKNKKEGMGQLMICSECSKQTCSWSGNYHSYSSLIAEIISIVQLLSLGLQVQTRPLKDRWCYKLYFSCGKNGISSK